MNTITIQKFDRKNLTFTATAYLAPSFVVDAEAFRGRVQNAHLNAWSMVLADALKSAQDAVTTAAAKVAKADDADAADVAQAALEKAQKRFAETEAAIDAFTAAAPALRVEGADPDRWAALFCIANKACPSYAVGNFHSDFYKPVVVPYVNQYEGAMSWNEARKKAFAGIRDGLNAYAAVWAKDADTDVYKSFTPEYSADAVTRFLRKASPLVKGAVMKTKDGDFAGFAVDVAKSKQVFTYAVQELFFKYGCKVVKATKEPRAWANF